GRWREWMRRPKTSGPHRCRGAGSWLDHIFLITHLEKYDLWRLSWPLSRRNGASAPGRTSRCCVVQDGVTVKYRSKTARFLAAATTAVVAGTLVSCSSGSEIDESEGIEGTTIRVTLANHVWTETIKELIPEF